MKAGHDWALEAIFERIEWALVHGAPPTKTKRPLPKGARVSHLLLVRLMPQRAEAAMRAWLIGKLPLSERASAV